MKTNTKSIVTPMIKEEMKELLKETEETIAACILKKDGRDSTFTVVDLWRMQKKHKTLGSSTRW